MAESNIEHCELVVLVLVYCLTGLLCYRYELISVLLNYLCCHLIVLLSCQYRHLIVLLHYLCCRLVVLLHNLYSFPTDLLLTCTATWPVC
jgi:hypothetical protein